MNAKSSSGYRSYASWVPKFLTDRPRYFVAHCVEKMRMASEMLPETVKEIGPGQVLVKGKTCVPGKNNHLVDFTVPSCECENWKLTYLPCKHMFAAINHLPHYTWHELPVNYRESSFFTLDDMHVLGDNDESSRCHHLPTNEGENEDNFGEALSEDSTVQLEEEATRTETTEESSNIKTVIKELGVTKNKGRKAIAAECRDVIDQVRNLTFLIADKDKLTELRDAMLDTLSDLKKVADRDNGFILEQERKPRMMNVRKQRRKKEGRKEVKQDKTGNEDNTRRHISKLKNLPTEAADYRGRKRRYGEGYEKKQLYTNIHLDLDTGLPGKGRFERFSIAKSL